MIAASSRAVRTAFHNFRTYQLKPGQPKDPRADSAVASRPQKAPGDVRSHVRASQRHMAPAHRFSTLTFLILSSVTLSGYESASDRWVGGHGPPFEPEVTTVHWPLGGHM